MNNKTHAKNIVKLLITRPIITYDGLFNIVEDKQAMIDIIENYLNTVHDAVYFNPSLPFTQLYRCKNCSNFYEPYENGVCPYCSLSF